MNIQQLVEKYKSNRDYYITNQYNETLLRSDFLDPFFELLGWDIKNEACKPTNEREVILEESIKANSSEHAKKPDYTFRLFSERKFFLEAKKPCISIESDNETAKQIRRYGFTSKLKISLLSNFEFLIFYDTSVKVDKDDTYQKALIKKYHYTEYESNFEEIKKLIGKEAVYSGLFDKMDTQALNSRALIPLQRQFEKTKLALDRLLAELYNLGENDSLIPLIKDLYEAD